MDATREGGTLAERQGMTAELGQAIASLASEALAEDRLRTAREILEGLVVSNPRDAVAWALLATAYRRLGLPEAGRMAAEAAVRLLPADPRVRLVRAEALLACPPERARARSELAALGREEGPVAARARALLAAQEGAPDGALGAPLAAPGRTGDAPAP